jgi:UDP-glucose 4-epimerase
MMILVTGASGYIGSYFIKYLTENFGYKNIKAIDSCINDIDQINGINIKKVDLTNQKEIPMLMKDVTTIVHFAGISSITECEQNSQRAIISNVLSIKYLMEEGTKNKLKKIIFPSSFAVYKPGQEYITEESIVTPYNFYGHLKHWAEQLIQSYKINHDIDYVIFRQTNVCGYGLSNKNTVVHAMCNAVKNNQPITIFGDGQQVRNFIHIKDAVHLYYLALFDNHGIYNLGGHETMSIKNIAQSISNEASKLLQTKVNINYMPSDRNGKEISTPNLTFDISHLVNDFGYSPTYSIKDMIKEMLI